MSTILRPIIDLKDRENPIGGARKFEAWFGDNREALSDEQVKHSEFVRLSFKTIRMNERDPDAYAAAWRLHDQTVDNFIASLTTENG